MNNKIIVSKRLETVAHMVTDGARLADVGTDHGFVPILLIQENKIKSALAMDLRKGPLERADEHIKELGLADKIATRLSDGMKALKEDEADAVVVAGMGGGLIIKILSDVDPIHLGIKEMVLGPQSDMDKVREFLDDNDYAIDNEDMIFEEGKYYQIIHVQTKNADSYLKAGSLDRIEKMYGPMLLKNKNEVLKQYLVFEKENLLKILDGLKKTIVKSDGSAKAESRMKEIEELLKINAEAMNRIVG